MQRLLKALLRLFGHQPQTPTVPPPPATGEPNVYVSPGLTQRELRVLNTLCVTEKNDDRTADNKDEKICWSIRGTLTSREHTRRIIEHLDMVLARARHREIERLALFAKKNRRAANDNPDTLPDGGEEFSRPSIFFPDGDIVEVHRAVRQFAKNHGRPPTDEELAQELDKPPKRVAWLRKMLN